VRLCGCAAPYRMTGTADGPEASTSPDAANDCSSRGVCAAVDGLKPARGLLTEIKTQGSRQESGAG
jgi:hypothetical protein